MQGPVPSLEQVQAEFSQRKQQVDAAVDKDKESKQSDQASRGAQRVMRNANAAKEEMKQMEENKYSEGPSKELMLYEKIFAQSTEFFSSCNPDLIEDALVQHLKEKE